MNFFFCWLNQFFSPLPTGIFPLVFIQRETETEREKYNQLFFSVLKLQEFTCPHCSKGFIEELPNVPEENNDVEMRETEASEAYADFNTRLTDELSSLFMSVTGARPPPPDEHDQQQQQQGSGSNGQNNGGTGRRRIRRRYGLQNINHFDNILHDLLISVTGNTGTVHANNLGGAPMFFMGNPGDYAWGREGLDTIVTQLLNQMESTGPPPLPTEKITEIPCVKVTQEQIDIKLQCSVCLENFQLNETVRKLSCLVRIDVFLIKALNVMCNRLKSIT